MNHDVVIYIISMLATIFFISSIILAALLYESKQKRNREATEGPSRHAIPAPKFETHRLATLHAWVEVDAKIAELMKPEELDDYLRAHLAQKNRRGHQAQTENREEARDHVRHPVRDRTHSKGGIT